MIKWTILLLLLYELTLSVKIEVKYDAQLNLIYNDGIIYLPASKDIRAGNFLNLVEVSQNQTKLFNEGNEEELVSGTELWFFIFIILCKINLFTLQF